MHTNGGCLIWAQQRARNAMMDCWWIVPGLTWSPDPSIRILKRQVSTKESLWQSRFRKVRYKIYTQTRVYLKCGWFFFLLPANIDSVTFGAEYCKVKVRSAVRSFLSGQPAFHWYRIHVFVRSQCLEIKTSEYTERSKFFNTPTSFRIMFIRMPPLIRYIYIPCTMWLKPSTAR